MSGLILAILRVHRNNLIQAPSPKLNRPQFCAWGTVAAVSDSSAWPYIYQGMKPTRMMSDPNVAGLITEYQNLLDNNFVSFAAAALIVYEYFITFDKEMSMWADGWRRRFSGPAPLFLVNRYLVLFTNLYNFTSFIPMSDESCARTAKVDVVLTLLQYLPWAVFSAKRAQGLSKDWRQSSLVFLLSVVTIGINFSQFHFGLTGVNIPGMGCVVSINVPALTGEIYTIVSRSCLICADLLLIYITWSYWAWAGLPRCANRENGLVGIILLDGTIYFVVLLILNALHLTLTLISVVPALQIASYVTGFTEPVTSILVSRFLLDLDSASQRRLLFDSKGMVRWTTTQLYETASSSTIAFERNVDAFAMSIIPGEGTGNASHNRFNNDIVSIRTDREDSSAVPEPEEEGDEETAEKPGLDREALMREASKESDVAMSVV